MDGKRRFLCRFLIRFQQQAGTLKQLKHIIDIFGNRFSSRVPPFSPIFRLRCTGQFQHVFTVRHSAVDDAIIFLPLRMTCRTADWDCPFPKKLATPSSATAGNGLSEKPFGSPTPNCRTDSISSSCRNK